MSMIELADFVAVRAALGQRVADAKFLAKGRKNAGPATDSEAVSASLGGVEVVAAVYHLTYEDAGGVVSERVVTVRRIERRGGRLYLHVLCHLRHAPRCFAVERVLDGYDISTGETFDRAEAYFADHPLFSEPDDPEASALQSCRHEINLLTVVGASDGLFDPDEQDALLIHVFERNEHLSLNEDRVRSLLALASPDQAAFDGALHQIARFGAGDARVLRRSLRRLVDADGVISPAEIRFVDEIERRLSLAA